MKHNFSSFLHQNKGFFVGLALAILSVMPLKSFSNELNDASAVTKAITEGAIAPYYQNNTKSDSAEAWLEKAYTAYYNKQYNEAIRRFKKAIKLNPNDATAYNGLGVVYEVGKKNYDEAIKSYNKAIELDPNIAMAYHNLGDVYKDGKKNYDEAIKYYKIAIELEFDNVYAYRKLAMVYAELENTEKAIECLNEVLRLENEASGE